MRQNITGNQTFNINTGAVTSIMLQQSIKVTVSYPIFRWCIIVRKRLLLKALSVSDKPRSGSMGSSAGAVWTFRLRENLITDWLWAKNMINAEAGQWMILTHIKYIRMHTDSVPAGPDETTCGIICKSCSPFQHTSLERAGNERGV